MHNVIDDPNAAEEFQDKYIGNHEVHEQQVEYLKNIGVVAYLYGIDWPRIKLVKYGGPLGSIEIEYEGFEEAYSVENLTILKEQLGIDAVTVTIDGGVSDAKFESTVPEIKEALKNVEKVGLKPVLYIQGSNLDRTTFERGTIPNWAARGPNGQMINYYGRRINCCFNNPSFIEFRIRRIKRILEVFNEVFEDTPPVLYFDNVIQGPFSPPLKEGQKPFTPLACACIHCIKKYGIGVVKATTYNAPINLLIDIKHAKSDPITNFLVHVNQLLDEEYSDNPRMRPPIVLNAFSHGIGGNDYSYATGIDPTTLSRRRLIQGIFIEAHTLNQKYDSSFEDYCRVQKKYPNIRVFALPYRAGIGSETHPTRTEWDGTRHHYCLEVKDLIGLVLKASEFVDSKGRILGLNPQRLIDEDDIETTPPHRQTRLLDLLRETSRIMRILRNQKSNINKETKTALELHVQRNITALLKQQIIQRIIHDIYIDAQNFFVGPWLPYWIHRRIYNIIVSNQ